MNSYSTYYNNFTPNNVSFGFQISIPFFDFGLRAKAKASAAEALRATVEAEQAQRQNDVQIADAHRQPARTGRPGRNRQPQAADRRRTAEDCAGPTRLGNGAGAGPGAQPQLSPKAEQLARIDERQKYEDALDAGFDLARTRLSLLRALGHMEDWLNELHGK